MTGPRLGDVPLAELRRMCKRPMTRFEMQPAPTTAPRPQLKPNERWAPHVFCNSRYSVQVSHVSTDIGLVTHLWIRRHDQEMSRSWSDMQRIKNELAGSERIAVEVFPAESELVDKANMSHLWVYPEDFVMPFTLGGGPQ
jgi:hypothetical protein